MAWMDADCRPVSHLRVPTRAADARGELTAQARRRLRHSLGEQALQRRLSATAQARLPAGAPCEFP